MIAFPGDLRHARAAVGGRSPWVTTHRLHHAFTDTDKTRTARVTMGFGGRTWVGY